MDGDGTLTLTFDEAMKASSITLGAITVQDAQTMTVGVPLDTSVFNSNPVADGTELTITFSRADRNAIKSALLANSADRAWIRFTPLAFADMNDQPVEPRDNGDAIQATNWYGDTTAPQLDSFDLNMATDTLTLYFNEPVDFASISSPFSTSAISFQNDVTIAPSSAYTLTTSTASAVSSQIVEVVLSKADRDNIKYIGTTEGGTALHAPGTYLSISSLLVVDSSANAIRAIGTDDAQGVDNYFPDDVPAKIVDYHMNMRTGTITITWNEPMQFPGGKLPLFALSSRAEVSHSFEVESETQSELYLASVYKLSKADLEAVKSLQLCDVAEDCILHTPNNWAADTSFVEFDAAVTTATGFQEDDIPPTLVSVPEFDANKRTVTLSFTETVNSEQFVSGKNLDFIFEYCCRN
jgi:hypothetical protein